MKKIVSVFLILALLLPLCPPAAAAQETGSASLNTVVGIAGGTVELTLTISDARPLKSMYVKPVYDTKAMTLTDIRWLDEPKPVLAKFTAKDGTAVMAMDGNTDLNGTVATLSFTLSQSIRDGSYSVGMEFTAKEKLSVGEAEVPLNVVPGTINVGCVEHTPVLQGTSAPSCTKAGYSGDEVCSNCGVTVKKGAVIPALGHEWSEVSYAWADDLKSCTATRSCKREGCNTIQTARGTLSSVYENGKYIYTAAFAERWAKTAVKEVAIESNVVVLRIGTVEANGDTVTVPITIEKNPGIGYIELTWSDKNDLSLEQQYHCYFDNADRKIKKKQVTWDNESSDVNTTGKVFDICFKLDPEASGKIDIGFSDCAVYSYDKEDYVTATVIPGAIVVPCTHQHTKVQRKSPASCEGSGYTGDTVCADCGALLEKGEYIMPLGHDWGESLCKQCTLQKPIEYHPVKVNVMCTVKVEDNSPLTQEETTQIIREMLSGIRADVGEALQEDTAEMKVELKEFTSTVDKAETEIKTTSVKYELKPTHSNGEAYTNAELKEKLDGKKIMFRLPIPDSMARAGATVYISHYLDGSTVPNSCEPLIVQGEEGALYVEYEADSFSVYELTTEKQEIDGDNTGLSLTLDGSVGLNVYLDVNHFLSAEEQKDAYIVMKYNHNTESYGTDLTEDARVYLKDATRSNGLVMVSASVTPAQILDEIHCSLYYGDGILCTEKVYSVKTYCDLAKTAGSEKLKPLCAALLDYGSACQTYFKYNAENPANGGSYDAALANVTAEGIQGFGYEEAYKPTGKSFMALTQSQVRFYFAEEPTAEPSCPGFAVEKGSSASGHYVAVTNIPASKLQEVFTLNVDGHEYTGCGLSYAKQALEESTNLQLSTLCKALIRYNETAVNYFNNRS